MSYGDPTGPNWLERHVKQVIIGAILTIILLIPGCFALDASTKSYGRYQARADAKNQIVLHSRLIQVEEQKRQIRVIEAEGIAEAQHIINATLTQQYLQHEAIQAMEMWAESGNNSAIYLPIEPGGMPLVKEVSPTEE